MKHKVTAFFICAMMIAGMIYPVHAEIQQTEITFLREENTIVVEGIAEPGEEILATVYTAEEKLENREFPQLQGQEQMTAKSDGSFRIAVPFFAPSGNYLVYVGGNATEKTKEQTIYCINEVYLDQTLMKLNSASEETFGKLLEKVMNELEIPAEDFETLKKPEAFYKILYKRKPEILSRENLPEFRAMAAEIAACCALDQGTAKDAVKYGELLNLKKLESFEEFSALTAEKREEITHGLKGCGAESAKELAPVFDEAAVVGVILAQNPLKMESALRKYQIKAGITSVFDKILKLPQSKRYGIYSNCGQQKANTYTELAQVLERAYRAEKNDGSQSGGRPGGGSGGTGGGGSVSGTASGSVGEVPKEPQEQACPQAPFTDLTEVRWAEDAILFLYGKGMVNGVGEGRFEPGRPVSREEFVKMLMIAFELSYDGEKTGFEDVLQDRWSFPYITAAVHYGIAKGFDGYFQPEAQITREDMAVLLTRTMQTVGRMPKPVREFKSFGDWGQVSEYAKDAVEYLYSCNLLSGKENHRFEPKMAATRAECAAMLYRIIK